MTTLAAAIADWLPQQRWYATKASAVLDVSVEVLATLQEGDPRLDLLVATVEHEGGTDRYQVPVSVRREIAPQLEHARIGTIENDDDETCYLYDGPHDHDVNQAWLRLMAGRNEVAGLVFEGQVEETDLYGRPMGAEQSNTSLNYDDKLILKLYRRLSPDPNPDLEVTRGLGAIPSEHVPGACGWVTGAGSTLGLLQPFLRGGTEGWALALTSVRDLYAESDLHAEEVGGDFAPESFRLGSVTATVHQDLARAFETRQAGPAETQATAAMLRERFEAAARTVPDLREYADEVERVYAALAELTDPVPVQRIHGDLHLGQVMRTDQGWFVLDFEGEPARPVEERRALMSPLRDVAGMLRSFDYAARHLLADHQDPGHLEYRAVEWADRNRNAFCDGYAHTYGSDPREQDLLLRAFELDKAVYEAVYEANHRPSWLKIPLAGIARLTRADSRS